MKENICLNYLCIQILIDFTKLYTLFIHKILNKNTYKNKETVRNVDEIKAHKCPNA